MANANLQAQIAAMKKKFEEKAKGVHGELFKSVTKACLLIEAEAKREMTETEIDGSKAYGKRQHHPSEPWSAPAIDYGMLRQSVNHDVEQDGARVIGHVGSTIVNPPIGAYLEHGTSKMMARPWMRPAFLKNREKIKALIQKAVRGREVGASISDTLLSVEATDASS